MVNWDLPCSASSVDLLTQLGAERGLSLRTCLDDSGIVPEVLADPAAEVTARQEAAVMRNLLRHCGGEPGLGVEAGRRYHIAAYGIWGLALISCKTVREVVDVALRYLELAFAFAPITFGEDGELAWLEIEDGGIPADIRPFLVDRITAGIHTIGQDLYSAGIPMREVRFRHPAPPDLRRYREVFGVEPVFAAEANRIAFDAALLDLELPQANDRSRRACEQMCRKIVEARHAATGIAGSIRHLLVRRPGRIPDLPAVAAELHMSTRTLTRRLAQEGTSFRALADEVREVLSEELLCSAAMTNEQIAFRLGYSEPAAFIRAFKRWKGLSPQAFRSRGAMTSLR